MVIYSFVTQFFPPGAKGENDGIQLTEQNKTDIYRMKIYLSKSVYRFNAFECILNVNKFHYFTNYSRYTHSILKTIENNSALESLPLNGSEEYFVVLNDESCAIVVCFITFLM